MAKLKELLPGELYTLSNREQVLIKPVPFGRLSLFSEAVASLIGKLMEGGIKLEGIEDWKILFDTAFEETLNIMALVLDKPREWFDTISISDGLGILNIVIEQNFSDDIKKNLKTLIGKASLILKM